MNKAQALAQAKQANADYLNKVTPLLLERLKQGFKLKNDNSFYKRDKEELDAIVRDGSKVSDRAWLSFNGYSISLKVSTWYSWDDPAREGSTTGAYEEDYVYLWDSQGDKFYDYEPRTAHTADEIEAAKVEYLKLEKESLNIASRMSELKRIFR